MSLIQFLGALEMGMIYGLVALAVYLSLRVIQFPDMSVDGSFPLGAAVCASGIIAGFSPLFATLLALFAGALAGSVTAFLYLKWRVFDLLAGILTMTALYSINLRLMGRPNIALLGEKTLISSWVSYGIPSYVILALILAIVWLALWRFLRSDLGLALRASGQQEKASEALGIPVYAMKWLGLAISNALVALAGALFAQVYGFADVSMGSGSLVAGLASVIIGQMLIRTRHISLILLSAILGGVIYRLAIALALNTQSLGLQASDINLASSLLIALALACNRYMNPKPMQKQR